MTLRLTPRAAADLDEIAAYLEPLSPRGALRVEAAIQEAFLLLRDFPEAGPLQQRGVRRFPLPRYPYLIFYRIDEVADLVDVLTVRHAARRPFSSGR